MTDTQGTDKMTNIVNTNTSANLHHISKQSLLTGRSHFDKKARQLAQKYYGTTDLSALKPYQLDKVTTWVTGYNPNKGKTQQRKAERALHNKRSGGKRYLNAGDKTKAILDKEQRH